MATEELLVGQLLGLAGNDLDSRRLRDCIPEAFGLVFASHLCSAMKPPDCFQARDDGGAWRPIPLRAELVFVHALPIALHIFHHGPRALFKNIAEMNSVVDALKNVLNASGSLEGSTLQGPQMLGLPASLYDGALNPTLPPH
ncbi:hypothetical protein [Variovorax sp. UC74_104]|uniref:hypothetical protein n=1 Tax=Variovorax sp. UC74_104 TaxID=3374555 RepID=UPI003757D2AE